MSWKSVAGMILLSAILVGVVDRYRSSISIPLGESPLSELQPGGFSELDRERFLEGNFKIVKDVRALPGPVVQAFAERGGSRSLMVNPGEKFETGDVITDPTLPRKRMIFSGFRDDRCFVHYAQGGRALSYAVEFFRVSSTEIHQVWKGYCAAPASDIAGLRDCVNRTP